MRRLIVCSTLATLFTLPATLAGQARARPTARATNAGAAATRAYLNALGETSDSAAIAVCKVRAVFVASGEVYEKQREGGSNAVLYGVLKNMMTAALPMMSSPFRRARTGFELVEPPARFARHHKVVSDLLARMDVSISDATRVVDQTSRAFEGPTMMSTVATKNTELQEAFDSYVTVRRRIAESAGGEAPELSCNLSKQ